MIIHLPDRKELYIQRLVPSLQGKGERRKVHAESETKREGDVLPLHPQTTGRFVYKLDMLATAIILCQNVARWFICRTFFKWLPELPCERKHVQGRGSGN